MVRTVRTGFDTHALASAVSKPGIDPRTWVTLAVVGGEQGFDPENGVFVDVELMPDGVPEVAFLPGDYSGGSAGTYFPVHQGDVVLCCVVQGDTANGVFIIKKLWSPTELPPGDIASSSDPTEPTTNAVIRVEDGATLRIIAKEGASINLECAGSGKINIAATGAAVVDVSSEATVTVDAPEVLLGASPGQGLARIGDIISGSVLALPNPGGVPIPFSGQIISGATSVKGGP